MEQWVQLPKPKMILSIDRLPKLTCLACGENLKLVCSEPGNAEGYDILHFACSDTDCAVKESFVVQDL